MANKKDMNKSKIDEEIIAKGKQAINDFDDSEEVLVSAKRPESKLISIRLPIDMIQSLRQSAALRGDIGYQQLIKNYISDGLTKDKHYLSNQIAQVSFNQQFYMSNKSETASSVEIVFAQKPVSISGDYIQIA